MLGAVAEGYGLTSADRGELVDWIDLAQKASERHCRDADTAAWITHERAWLAEHRRSLAL